MTEHKPWTYELIGYRQQLAWALAVVWEMVKRRPFLMFWPVLLYMRVYERELLWQWVREAEYNIFTRRWITGMNER